MSTLLENKNNYDKEDSLYSQFFLWMYEVLGLNCSMYDINLNETMYLHKSLNDINEKFLLQ